jgi:hypothetical protein
MDLCLVMTKIRVEICICCIALKESSVLCRLAGCLTALFVSRLWRRMMREMPEELEESNRSLFVVLSGHLSQGTE